MNDERRTMKGVLVGVIFLAVVMRVVVGVLHPFWFPDSVDYDLLAKGILHGGNYEVGGLVASRMPGYALFVAGVYAVREGVSSVMVVQALLGGVGVWLVYLIGRRVGECVGMFAALLAAVDPLSVGFSAAFLSEGVFTVLMLGAIWGLMRVMECGMRNAKCGMGWWVFVGVMWGVAVYMRASALWCVVPLVGWAFLMMGGRAWVGALVAVGIVFLGLVPWEVRNYGIFHSGFFRLTTLEGISLYEAVYPGADGGPKQDVIELPDEMKGMGEAERNDEWGRRGWGYVWSDPLRVVELALRKMGRTWSPWMNAAEFRGVGVQVVMVMWHVPLFILGLVGIFSGGMPMRWRGLLFVPVIYFTLVHGLFLGSVRYRVPLMPVVCVFAAVGLMRVFGKRGKRETATRV